MMLTITLTITMMLTVILYQKNLLFLLPLSPFSDAVVVIYVNLVTYSTNNKRIKSSGHEGSNHRGGNRPEEHRRAAEPAKEWTVEILEMECVRSCGSQIKAGYVITLQESIYL